MPDPSDVVLSVSVVVPCSSSEVSDDVSVSVSLDVSVSLYVDVTTSVPLIRGRFCRLASVFDVARRVGLALGARRAARGRDQRAARFGFVVGGLVAGRVARGLGGGVGVGRGIRLRAVLGRGGGEVGPVVVRPARVGAAVGMRVGARGRERLAARLGVRRRTTGRRNVSLELSVLVYVSEPESDSRPSSDAEVSESVP